MPGPYQSVKVIESQAFDSLNSYDHCSAKPTILGTNFSELSFSGIVVYKKMFAEM